MFVPATLKGILLPVCLGAVLCMVCILTKCAILVRDQGNSLQFTEEHSQQRLKQDRSLQSVTAHQLRL